MSRACAMSARNCFWIRNRRLPMLALPSIKNDKSTLQSEEWKGAVILVTSHWIHLCIFSPLSLPEPPEIRMERKWKEVVRCREYSFIYIHNRFLLGIKVLDTWVSTYHHNCFSILCISQSYRFLKQWFPGQVWEGPLNGFPGSDHIKADTLMWKFTKTESQELWSSLSF